MNNFDINKPSPAGGGNDSYNIKVQGNKIIVNGHASDIETCNTLTNICDELNNSDKFETVNYEAGYGEFESVVENGDKKFAPQPPSQVPIYVRSNDGETVFLFYESITDPELQSPQQVDNGTIVLTNDTLLIRNEYYTICWWTYSGNKKFLGLSDTINSTTPKYIAGSGFQTVPYTAGVAINLYIVEADLPSTTIKYDGSQIAEVPSGDSVILDTKDKWLNGRIEVSNS